MTSRRRSDAPADESRTMAIHGAGLGIVSGLILAGAEVASASMMGSPPLAPFQMFASIALGRPALSGMYSLPTLLVVGAVVHVGLSAVFGVLYGMFLRYRTRETQTSFAREAGLGMLYGLVLWAFNFYIVAPALFPWFLQVSPLEQALLHAVCYGLPLGVMFAAATRRLALPSAYTASRVHPRTGPPARQRPSFRG